MWQKILKRREAKMKRIITLIITLIFVSNAFAKQSTTNQFFKTNIDISTQGKSVTKSIYEGVINGAVAGALGAKFVMGKHSLVNELRSKPLPKNIHEGVITGATFGAVGAVFVISKSSMASGLPKLTTGTKNTIKGQK